jgi:hypothetical protein
MREASRKTGEAKSLATMKEALPQRKKSRAKALLQNCVDPIFPKSWI